MEPSWKWICDRPGRRMTQRWSRWRALSACAMAPFSACHGTTRGCSAMSGSSSVNPGHDRGEATEATRHQRRQLRDEERMATKAQQKASREPLVGNRASVSVRISSGAETLRELLYDPGREDVG